MFLRRIKIAPRALLSFSLVALLVVLLGLFALFEMRIIRAATVDLAENSLPGYRVLGVLNEKMLRIRVTAYRIVVDREPAALRDAVARLDELSGQLRDARSQYEALISSDSERAQYQSMDTALADFLRVNQQLIQLSEQDRLEEIHALLPADYSSLSERLAVEFEKLLEINQGASRVSAEQAEAEFRKAITGVVIFMLVAAALTALLAVLLTRSIVKPLGEAVKFAGTVASGDLTDDIAVSGGDEPAQLLGSLKSMQQSLRRTIQGIVDSSTQLASAAEELNAVTEDSSKGLLQQNQEIEQAATAVNEMTTAVDEVARNAVATSEASRDSDHTARQGQEQVNKTVDSISHLAEDVTATAGQVEQLAEKIRHISTVLDVIRSIADQTNLLALNAAIEAARAGDAGRGFAVVADEVRALAHRTQQSTQEIEQMINGIQQGTDQAMGSMQASNERAHSTLELARAAGAALQQITEAISHITERNLVIASASEEQAQVAREVDRNLVNIRDLAVQTSAGANQTNAASQELSRLAIDLNGLVTRFRI